MKSKYRLVSCDLERSWYGTLWVYYPHFVYSHHRPAISISNIHSKARLCSLGYIIVLTFIYFRYKFFTLKQIFYHYKSVFLAFKQKYPMLNFFFFFFGWEI